MRATGRSSRPATPSQLANATGAERMVLSAEHAPKVARDVPLESERARAWSDLLDRRHSAHRARRRRRRARADAARRRRRGRAGRAPRAGELEGCSGPRRPGQQRRRRPGRRPAAQGEVLPGRGRFADRPGAGKILGPGGRRPVRHRPRARHRRRVRRAGRVREPPALPGARPRHPERRSFRQRARPRPRGARDAHHHLHRAQARPAHSGRAGSLRGDSGCTAGLDAATFANTHCLGRRAEAVPRPAQAPAAQLPQGNGRLARHPRRRRGHDRRRAARRPRGAQDGCRPRLHRFARRRPCLMDLSNPELMLRHPDDALGQDLDALVVGPGSARASAPRRWSARRSRATCRAWWTRMR